MATIDETILNLWKQGYSVVLVGHSQGSLFVNKAYDTRLFDRDGKTAASGKRLPNPNVLSVVLIASPANRVADGRFMYTTQCSDFITHIPGALPPDICQ